MRNMIQVLVLVQWSLTNPVYSNTPALLIQSQFTNVSNSEK